MSLREIIGALWMVGVLAACLRALVQAALG